jgi:signal transduction histidine kinase/CheY-like chemotaxis protein/HPt (histidine-containing phosphotransfer) domain-containing protein
VPAALVVLIALAGLESALLHGAGQLGVRKVAPATDLERPPVVRMRLDADEDIVERHARLALESRAKSEFLANIGHEIRTPMNAIVGTLGLLLQTDLSQRQRDLGRTIQCGTESLLRILDDLLDITQLETGKLEFEHQPFDFYSCVESVVDVLYHEARRKGLALTYFISPSVPVKLKGDGRRLRQILACLLGNGVKYTEQGSVSLRIVETDRTGRDIGLSFSLRDTGPGIPSECIEELLTPFTSEGKPRTANSSCTGLGLAISKNLIEVMGGELEIESAPDHGTHVGFSVRLSLDESRSSEAEDEGALSDIRVLVADDDRESRAVLVEHLANWGIEYQEAGDAAAAQALLRGAALDGRAFDLAILGEALPGGGDALGLAEDLQHDGLTRGTRLILLSTLGRALDTAALVRCGFEAWLTKPLCPRKLRSALCHAFHDTPRGAPEQGPASALPERAESRALHPYRVLLVEDNFVNQKVATMLLSRFGCRTRIANNGKEALQAIDDEAFDLVLMDCQMPVMDGYQAAREIRARSDAASDLPIIAMTAHAMSGDRRLCLDAGMDDYMAKPVQVGDLARMLEKWGKGTSHREPQERRECHDMNDQPDTDVLDPDVIESLRELGDDDGMELLAELVDLFLLDAPERMAELFKAFEENDTEQLERTAHALKSSSANLGALGLSGIFGDLEQAGREQDLSRAGALLEQSRAEYHRVEAALKQEVE